MTWDRVPRAVLHGIWNWLFERPNCIFQIFYVSLLVICYANVWNELWPSMNSVDQFTASLTAILALSLFLRVSFTDPGRITEKNISSFKHYPNHSVLYPRGKLCRTCNTTKIPRSKHCRVCNQCIARFDHHCIWVNTCVATNNYGAFFGFLIINMLGSAHIAYLSMNMFINTIQGSLHPWTTNDEIRTLLVDAMHMKSNLTFVACLSALVWFLVSCLMGCQFSRVYRNTTTNEYFRRQALKSTLAAQEKERPQLRPIQLDLTWGVFDKEEVGTMTEEDIDYNPYDRGIAANILDALVPSHDKKND